MSIECPGSEEMRPVAGPAGEVRFLSVVCSRCGADRVAKVPAGATAVAMPGHKPEGSSGVEAVEGGAERPRRPARRGRAKGEGSGARAEEPRRATGETAPMSAPTVLEPVMEGEPVETSTALAWPAASLSVPMPASVNAARVYIASLSNRGATKQREGNARRTMRRALALVLDVAGERADVEAFPWHALRYQHTAAIRAALVSRGLAAATVNQALCALRGVLREAWKLGMMSAEEMHRAVEVKGQKAQRLPAGRALPEEEQAQLFGACSASSNAGARDAAMLAVGFGAGLRREEIAGLSLDNFDAGASSLRVTGKGNKQREVPLVNGALEALQAWLARRGREPGPLFCRIDEYDRITMRALSPEAVRYVIDRARQKAGTPKASPHNMRHTYVSSLLEAGADLAIVQRLAGHASITTTAGYDRRGEDAKRRAAELLRTPYRRRGA